MHPSLYFTFVTYTSRVYTHIHGLSLVRYKDGGPGREVGDPSGKGWLLGQWQTKAMLGYSHMFEQKVSAIYM